MTFEQQLTELKNINQANLTFFTEKFPPLMDLHAFLVENNYHGKRYTILKTEQDQWQFTDSSTISQFSGNGMNSAIHYNWEKLLEYLRTHPVLLKIFCDRIPEMEKEFEDIIAQCISEIQRKN